MKNKSKLKKIREKNHGAADAPKEWFYMQQKEITVRDIADALQEEADLELEIWEAAGVLEGDPKNARWISSGPGRNFATNTAGTGSKSRA